MSQRASVRLRRVVVALLVAALVALLVLARQGGEAGSGGVRIVVWHSQRGAEKELLESLLRRFNEQHRGSIYAEPLAVPESSFKDKVLRTVPRGAGPDVFLRPHNELGEFLRDEVLRPVESHAFPKTRASYHPGLIDGVSSEGTVYGVPLTFKALVLFYDQELYPSGPPADLDELLRNRERKYPLVYDATSFFFHAPFFLASGGRIFDEQGKLSPFEGAGLASFEEPKAWRAAGILPPDVSYNDAVRLFEDGSAGSLINGPWYAPKAADGRADRFAIAPLPVRNGKPMGSLVTVEAAFMSKSTTQPAAAEELVRFLAGEEAALLRASKLGLPPPFAVSDPEVKANVSIAVQTQSLVNGQVTPASTLMAAVWRPADDVLKASMRGEDLSESVAVARATLLEVQRPRPSGGKPVFFGVALTALLGLATMMLVRRVRLDVASPDAARSKLLGNYGAGAVPFLLPGLISTALLVLVPALVAAGMSFFEYHEGSFEYVGLANFHDILLPSLDRAFASRSFYFALAVTILWTLVNVFCHLTLGVLVALCLRPAWVKLRGFFRVLLVLPWAIPNYITALMWKGMFHAQVGAINALLAPFGFEGFQWFNTFYTAFLANVLTNTWLGFPFMMIVTLGALTSIPKEVEEAAELDGASKFQRFTLVLFPYLRPALVPSIILGSVWTFNMFNVVYLVSGGEPASETDILISEAYRWAFERGQRFGYAAAYSVLIFAFLLLYGRLTERVSKST